ncbi:hypothetical protein [Janthinobacterium sp.]|uniref:hypothetical protein n=1 Tax=Janthinobacterium sp. TaxID=1871054 RepID=UPI0025847BF1|nr:hypothetical protein [Janthinobacterium sp.]MCX7292751.1 hypothetical protein [Janthinobacterium sp.]
MTYEPIESNDDDSLFSLTSEERTEHFKKLLEELDEKPTELASRLIRLGDYRNAAAIMRGIQRMAAGDTKVSGEMLVIVRMLVNQQRLQYSKLSQVEWAQQAKGAWVAKFEGFKITLHPQTKDRWSIYLRVIETDYSPACGSWQVGLEAAKRKALVRLADGQMEAADLAAGRL